MERSKNYNVIGSKWVFRNKQNENGMVVRNKTRLVAQDFTQVEGVAKMASHAIFQYNVLAVDDTHNTWTNMIVKTNIPRLFRFK